VHRTSQLLGSLRGWGILLAPVVLSSQCEYATEANQPFPRCNEFLQEGRTIGGKVDAHLCQECFVTHFTRSLFNVTKHAELQVLANNIGVTPIISLVAPFEPLPELSAFECRTPTIQEYVKTSEFTSMFTQMTPQILLDIPIHKQESARRSKQKLGATVPHTIEQVFQDDAAQWWGQDVPASVRLSKSADLQLELSDDLKESTLLIDDAMKGQQQFGKKARKKAADAARKRANDAAAAAKKRANDAAAAATAAAKKAADAAAAARKRAADVAAAARKRAADAAARAKAIADDLARKAKAKVKELSNKAKLYLLEKVNLIKRQLILKFFTALMKIVPSKYKWARDALHTIGMGSSDKQFVKDGTITPSQPLTRAKVAICNLLRSKKATEDIKTGLLNRAYESLRQTTFFKMAGATSEIYMAVTNPRIFSTFTAPSIDCPTTYRDEQLHDGMVQLGKRSVNVTDLCSGKSPDDSEFAWCLGDADQPEYKASSWEEHRNPNHKIGKPTRSLLRPCRTMKSFEADQLLYRQSCGSGELCSESRPKFNQKIVSAGSLNARNTPHTKMVIDRWLVLDNNFERLKIRKLLCRGEVYSFAGFCTGCCCAKGLMIQSSHSALTVDNMKHDPQLRDEHQSCTDWFAFLDIASSFVNGINRAMFISRKQFGSVCKPYAQGGMLNAKGGQ